MTGIELIAKEREEQITKHDRTVMKDKQFNQQYQLRHAAQLIVDVPLIRYNNLPDGWNRDLWSKMCDKPYTERLAIAGAWMAAEIDRVEGS